MLPSQRRFTVFAVIFTVGLVLFVLYEAKADADWSTGLVMTLVIVLVLGFKYGYWMMRLEEWHQKKARKKEGQGPI